MGKALSAFTKSSMAVHPVIMDGVELSIASMHGLHHPSPCKQQAARMVALTICSQTKSSAFAYPR